MSAKSKRVRRKHRHKTSRWRRPQLRSAITIAVFILVGFAVGLFIFSWLHKGWNRWRESRLLTQASASLDQGDLDKAANHVVAGRPSRAQGNIPDEERHFAAAVAREPSNDLYQFNLAVLQIQSPDPEKNAAARNQLERLSKVTRFRSAA